MQNADIQHKTVLIRINKLYYNGMPPQELYEITRGIWVIGERRETAELAMAVYKGVVIEVYRVHEWHPAGTTEYETRDGESFLDCGRWEFTGEIAKDVRDEFVGKSIKHHLVRYNANPIVYVNM